jgi:hypothetical protein
MTDHYLKPEQEQRALALSLAHPLLVGKTIAGQQSVDIFDLMRLAQWILDGSDLIDTIAKPLMVSPPLIGNAVGDWTDAEDEDDERV